MVDLGTRPLPITQRRRLAYYEAYARKRLVQLRRVTKASSFENITCGNRQMNVGFFMRN